MDKFCGTDGHPPSCLCDVTITQPVTFLDESIYDMWENRRIAQFIDPHDDLIGFLQTMLDVYDRTRTVQGMLPIIPASEREATYDHLDHALGFEFGRDPDAEARRELEELPATRDAVLAVLEHVGSMTKVAAALNAVTDFDWTLGSVLQCITVNRYHQTWEWSEHDWERAERLLVTEAGKHTASHLVKELGVSENSLVTVAGWYGKKPYRTELKGNRFCEDAAKRREIISDWLDYAPSMPAKVMYEELLEQGFTMSYASVRNQRNKLAKKKGIK